MNLNDFVMLTQKENLLYKVVFNYNNYGLEVVN